jgi:DNA-binding PadR family transcriptional regulator
MDESFHSLSDESLDFHLRYMADKGWIEIGEEKVPGKDPVILYAKITAAGVEEFDRRRRQITRVGRTR